MNELKQMLEAIHKENKDILFLLCLSDFDNPSEEELEELVNGINERYDEKFYGNGPIHKTDNDLSVIENIKS